MNKVNVGDTLYDRNNGNILLILKRVEAPVFDKNDNEQVFFREILLYRENQTEISKDLRALAAGEKEISRIPARVRISPQTKAANINSTSWLLSVSKVKAGYFEIRPESEFTSEDFKAA